MKRVHKDGSAQITEKKSRFIGDVYNIENEEDALDYALSQVNNISKKRLLGNLQELKTQLFRLEPNTGVEEKANPFLI